MWITDNVYVTFVLLLATIASEVNGHGRLTEPPSRSSMWRFGFDNPKNYDDNALFCGGFAVQWQSNGGKCGVCGDRYDIAVRDNEAPDGKYAKNGIIVRKYSEGQEITIRVHITANHKGWFEFRLCQNDVKLKRVTQDCFDKHLLATKGGLTRFPIALTDPEYFTTKVVLPAGLTCRNCVLQWKYNTGNSWGIDFTTQKGCMGCGPQEQFYGCADVAVGHDDIQIPDEKEVEVPAGDVDERTEWKKKKHQQQTCCPCNTGFSSHRMSVAHVYIVALFVICSLWLKL